MIRVDGIYAHQYSFPTIDFKFLNRGNATAFLWRFTISVEDAKIDLTPKLDFHARVVRGSLRVGVTNQGWGTARSCSIEIEEPVLNQVFDAKARQFVGDVGAGDEHREVVFDFSNSSAIPEQRDAISKTFAIVDAGQYIGYTGGIGRQVQVRGIRLQRAHVVWKCKDDEGTSHQGEDGLLGGDTFFTEDGFVEIHHPPPTMSAAGSELTYSAIIDPSRGTHSREYSISRKIAPGDVERFHIMIGTPVSCKLRLRFKFSIGEAATVQSDVFDLSIWNPRNWRLHRRYADGAELRRTLEEMEGGLVGRQLRPWEKAHYDRIWRQVNSYPFIDTSPTVED